MKIIVEFDSWEEFQKFIPQAQKKDLPKNVWDLGLSTRTRNILLAERIELVQDLRRLSPIELSRIPNMGDKSIQEILGCLEQYLDTPKEERPL